MSKFPASQGDSATKNKNQTSATQNPNSKAVKKASSGYYSKSTQIRLQLPSQNFKGSGLPNPIRPDQSKHLPGPWHRQPATTMQYNTVYHKQQNPQYQISTTKQHGGLTYAA